MNDIRSNHAYHIQNLIEADEDAEVVYVEYALQLERRIKELEAQLNPWISVKERLPDIEDTFMVTVVDGSIRFVVESFFNGKCFTGGENDSLHHLVIRWCEKPQPYKGE